MEKNTRKNKITHKRVGILKGRLDAEIHKAENSKGRKLSKEEIEKIKNKVFKSMAVRFVAGIGAAFMIGSTAYRLGEGSARIEGVSQDNEKNVTVNTSELENGADLYIKGQNDNEIFVNNLKVDIGSIEDKAKENAIEDAKTQQREQLIQQVKEIVSGFQTKEDVLQYMKYLYSTEYTKETGQMLQDFGIIFTQDGTIKTIDNESSGIIEQVNNRQNVPTDNRWYLAKEGSEVLLDLSAPLEKLEYLREEYNKKSGKDYLETYVNQGVVDEIIKYYDNQQAKEEKSNDIER